MGILNFKNQAKHFWHRKGFRDLRRHPGHIWDFLEVLIVFMIPMQRSEDFGFRGLKCDIDLRWLNQVRS